MLSARRSLEDDRDFEDWIRVKEAEFQRQEDAEADDFNEWAEIKAENADGIKAENADRIKAENADGIKAENAVGFKVENSNGIKAENVNSIKVENADVFKSAYRRNDEAESAVDLNRQNDGGAKEVDDDGEFRIGVRALNGEEIKAVDG